MKQTFLLIMASAALGCGNYHESLKAADTINAVGFQSMGFAPTEALVLGPSCTGCHSDRRGNAGGINLETFVNVQPLVAKIRAAVASDAMPLGGPSLQPLQKSILFAWIDAGAPETSTLPLTP